MYVQRRSRTALILRVIFLCGADQQSVRYRSAPVVRFDRTQAVDILILALVFPVDNEFFCRWACQAMRSDIDAPGLSLTQMLIDSGGWEVLLKALRKQQGRRGLAQGILRGSFATKAALDAAR